DWNDPKAGKGRRLPQPAEWSFALQNSESNPTKSDWICLADFPMVDYNRIIGQVVVTGPVVRG
ncbi:MAG: hypothetical protein FWD94_07540, partial [Treponema sp.]|nr:hypothetical protein [Treponema sp.]